MKKILSLLLVLSFSCNIFAAAYPEKNSLNRKLFKELSAIKGTKITIKEAVKMALKDSYQVDSATKVKEIYEQIAREAKSAYYPQLSIEASYNRVLQKTKSLATNVLTDDEYLVEVGTNNTYKADLQANLVLWTGGKIKNSAKYTKIQAESGEYSLKHTKSLVAKEVVNFCYTIIYASALVHVQEEYLEIAKQHLEETKARYKQGLSSNLDVLSQQVRVDNIVPQVLQAKKNVELSTLYLRQILNKDPESQIFLTWTEEDLTVSNTPDIHQLYNTAFERRPELIVSKLAVDMAESNLKIAKAGHMPTLAAYGNYGYNGLTNEGLPDNKHYYFGSNVGLSLSFPLFEGFSVSAQVSQKQKYYENALASYENQKKNVRIQVKEAWLNLQEAKQRINATKGVVSQAQENLNSKMLRYRNGLISQLELNDAISDLNDSNLKFVQAVYDTHVALSNLNYAVGMETKDYE